MKPELGSLEAFDTALSTEYASLAAQMPDGPEASVQRRFGEYGVFPRLGWDLIGVGDAQALAENDPAILYGTIARFTKCAHACWGRPDERGLHWGGHDFCALVVPSLYSALLGKTYLASVFRCDRGLSVTGHGAYTHAANLMVCLECKPWQHMDKAVSNARAFVTSKGNSKADRAFVGFFLSIHAGDKAQVILALKTFAEAYSKSDWGRHKPLTKPTLIHAMIVYARFYLADPVDERTHRALVPGGRFDLWQQYERRHSEFEHAPHRFAGALGFLNALPVR